MRFKDLITESAIDELVKQLPSLAKHDDGAIDRLMKDVAKKHSISSRALERLFRLKYKKTPHHWLRNKLDEIEHPLVSAMGAMNDLSSSLTDKATSITDKIMYEGPGQLDIDAEVAKFADWAMRRVHLKNPIKIDLSYDTKEAQDNHHTGRHVEGDPTIWVYAANRNLVDILRTVFHEIVHCRQSELGMIQPGDSYPGSPIEAMADMLAGKYIKIYGEKNHHIFQ